MTVRLLSCPRFPDSHVLNRSSRVFVTGATGMIGGEILRGLSRARVRSVRALVRATDDPAAVSRLNARLMRSGMTPTQAARMGVEALPGDVTQPGWGLACHGQDLFARDTDIVIHCAADTSFIRHDTVRQTNVEGVRHLVELAGRCPRPPLIVYVSTATNAGKVVHRCVEEDEAGRSDRDHHNEYTRSKAEAESILRASGLPILILRPTIVLSAGVPDAGFAQDILWFAPLLETFARLPLDAESLLDIVPVRWVVDSALALLSQPGRQHDCYHLSAGREHSTPLSRAMSFIDRFYGRRTPLELVPPASWSRQVQRSEVTTARQRVIFSGLRHYLPFLNMNVSYDDTRLRAELKGAWNPVPPVETYAGDVLRWIRTESAFAEAACP